MIVTYNRTQTRCMLESRNIQHHQCPLNRERDILPGLSAALLTIHPSGVLPLLYYYYYIIFLYFFFGAPILFSEIGFCMASCSCICYKYSTVGRRHIYRGAKRQGKYATEVVYRGCGLTYRIIYTIYYGECTTDESFA